MTLTLCPYDGTHISVGVARTGAVVIECQTCEAAWEYHTTWITQLRKPNRSKARAARRRAIVHSTGPERVRT
jgi:hypothetical protein